MKPIDILSIGNISDFHSEPSNLHFFMVGKSRTWPPLILTAPFITKKNFVPFMRFMVLKTTGLNPQFQCKSQFWKICTESRDISQNVSKFRLPNQTSGLSGYLSNLILALEPVVLSTQIFKGPTPQGEPPHNFLRRVDSMAMYIWTSNFGMAIIYSSFLNLKPSLTV